MIRKSKGEGKKGKAILGRWENAKRISRGWDLLSKVGKFHSYSTHSSSRLPFPTSIQTFEGSFFALLTSIRKHERGFGISLLLHIKWLTYSTSNPSYNIG